MIIVVFKIIGLLFIVFIIGFILSACKLQKRCEKLEEEIFKQNKDINNKLM